MFTLNEKDIEHLLHLAKEAAKEILSIYHSQFEITIKSDSSPLTEADTISNGIITTGLKQQFPRIPILAEESRLIPYYERKDWEYFWLVDPLDGTKEFIKKNGEFTINIALVRQTTPVFGLIYAPVKQTAYYNIPQKGVYKQLPEGTIKKVTPTYDRISGQIILIGSRSHGREELQAFTERMKETYNSVDLISAGSALKFCLLVEGRADIYPRFTPTMEWDTAAGHALIKEIGKEIYLWDTASVLQYNKENLRNPWFIVK
jgi:3'(2'), 5'-bisphosphate nucleotidase